MEKMGKWIDLFFQRDLGNSGYLTSIVLVLWKRKWLLIGTLCIVLVGVGIKIIITKPSYSSTAVIKIGEIGITSYNNFGSIVAFTEKSIEKAEVLAERIQYFPNNVKGGSLSNVSVNKETNSITMTANGDTPIAAQALLNDITNKIISEHNQAFKDIDSIQKKIVTLFDKRFGSTGQYQNNYTPLMGEVNNISSILTKNKSTEFLLKPTLPSTPIKPSKKLELSIALLVGLVLSFFVVFAAEFISLLQLEYKKYYKQT